MIKIKRRLCAALLFTLAGAVWGAQDGGEAEGEPEKAKEGAFSVLTVFHRAGWNLLHSFSYNYGANFLSTVPLTWGLVASGGDWGWYKLMYGKPALAGIGATVNILGYGGPALFPLISYVSGVVRDDRRLQLMGLAMAQASVFGSGIPFMMKLFFIGRRQAGVYDRDPQMTDYSDEFSFGFNRNGTVDGWPSGHTAGAVAHAVIVAEFYQDSLLVKTLAYTYDGIMAIGMTMCDHWLSDVLAGALMGFAIGKVVGKSFSSLLAPPEKTASALSFYINPVSVGLIYRW